MSSTTTTTTTTTSRAVDASTLSILSDYEIHHTGSETQPQPRVPRDAVPVSQPADWPSHYRRIPSYRPVNRNLSYEERSAGTSPVEYMFIQTMLHGVWLNASVARLWRFTGGRINDKIFHYEVGGEW
ncbi:uncharacterized protein AKAW2_12002A [Aspergillus luchuensis]|uniref:Uncharacterized protein n=2 Tax=Aspergillus subgen. Circumdati TaxID=2720871 RepID=A0A8G1RCH1_9EURO|nr:hypothetical protein BO85DRAFT_444479 [Aspergillus piperis CBS 112811]XP_041538722.1 uncharacterized protein AKAW2_12002A [Aspergillus luchuensis]GAA86033.1 similar to An07g01410 [Aspergillus luchuensis IFO 4308]RAH63137.1 hypothetical protein BO85DRAFT_444479 [Aspergillus piperis CBS 112811]BCR94956.1 hypothetical protein AKAW2_12002A [Aspergillus luchuensis]BCS07529.1 hypothetical protein ALUC_11910A [Aspergillus luchuensis]GAT19538.1 similar to An07g01410 [Aspergillus luchuensis]